MIDKDEIYLIFESPLDYGDMWADLAYWAKQVNLKIWEEGEVEL